MDKAEQEKRAQKKSEEKFNNITKKRKPEEKIAVDKSTALLL